MVSAYPDSEKMQVTQRCPRCQHAKPKSEYHPDKWGTVGAYCQTCAVDYHREWKIRRGITRIHGPERPPRTPVQRALGTSYRAVHKQVQRTKGHADTHPCAHCTSTAKEWAYDHADPNEVDHTARGKACKYSLHPQHYLPLCKSCHARFDGRSRRATQPQPQPQRTRGTVAQPQSATVAPRNVHVTAW